MLVPWLKLNLASVDEVTHAVDHVFQCGLLGKVAIEVAPECDLDSLEKLAVQTGRRIDLQVFLVEYSDDLAIRLLNAGASKILVQSVEPGTQVPNDRLQFFSAQQLADIISESAPNVTNIVEQWQQRNDTWVAAAKWTDVVGDVLIELLRSDREDGLWPTVIVDRLGVALGLAYSNEESLRHAIAERCGTYWSRSRNGLWIKGETSGARQQLYRIDLDCDFDTLRFTVEQTAPGFCHHETHTCFGSDRNIAEVFSRLQERVSGSDTKSFTRKLFDDPEMLRKKLLEEAAELSDADDPVEAAWESADVLYFSMIALLRNDASLADVYDELRRRMQRVVRRKNKLEKET